MDDVFDQGNACLPRTSFSGTNPAFAPERMAWDNGLQGHPKHVGKALDVAYMVLKKTP
jgi:hypothetical protein